MLVRILTALAVGVLAAFVIDQGFGPGFIDDRIAYPAIVYVCLLIALLVRSQDARKRPLLLNLVSHGVVGAIVLLALRSVLQFELPLSTFTTTGHFPYFAVPVAAASAQLVWELLPLGIKSDR